MRRPSKGLRFHQLEWAHHRPELRLLQRVEEDFKRHINLASGICLSPVRRGRVARVGGPHMRLSHSFYAPGNTTSSSPPIGAVHIIIAIGDDNHALVLSATALSMTTGVKVRASITKGLIRYRIISYTPIIPPYGNSSFHFPILNFWLITSHERIRCHRYKWLCQLNNTSPLERVTCWAI